MTYKINKEFNIFLPNERKDFGYSDGDSIENEIYNSITQTTDRSYNSAELADKATNWASIYHFGIGRATAIDALKLPKSSTILEIGGGCGAISRYLAERFDHVDSVEGSFNRAKIISERCKDLQNINIYCDNIENFKIDKTYDYIIINGVLEYSPLFIKGNSPEESCVNFMKIVTKFLKKTGSAIITIENKIGLKYRSGFPEDHTSWHFDGINDYPNKNKPMTFSKKTLNKIMIDSDLLETAFYYPYPDYKFPNTVISDIQNEKYKKYIHNRIPKYKFLGGDKPFHLFDDTLATKVLSEAGIVDEYSNSFMVIASKNKIKEPSRLAKRYSLKRNIDFQVVTTLYPNKKNEIEKERITSKAGTITKAGKYFTVSHTSYEEKYIEGNLLSYDFTKALLSRSKKDLPALFTKYKERITSNYKEEGKDKFNSPLVSGELIDALPSNIIVGQDGSYNLMDTERKVDQPVSVDFIVYRSLKHNIYPSVGIITRMLMMIGFGIRKNKYYGKLDSDYQSIVCEGVAKKKTYIKSKIRVKRRIGSLLKLTKTLLKVV